MPGEPITPANVKGRCPMGCGETLFLGEGGYVTCSLAECPDPASASEILRVGGDVEMLLAGLDVPSLAELEALVRRGRWARDHTSPDPRWIPGYEEATGS